MASVHHLGIILPPYETTHEDCCWPQLAVKFHVNLIHTSEDIAILIFRILGLKVEMPIQAPKMGIWGISDSLDVIIYYRDPKRHILA